MQLYFLYENIYVDRNHGYACHAISHKQNGCAFCQTFPLDFQLDDRRSFLSDYSVRCEDDPQLFKLSLTSDWTVISKFASTFPSHLLYHQLRPFGQAFQHCTQCWKASSSGLNISFKNLLSSMNIKRKVQTVQSVSLNRGDASNSEMSLVAPFKFLKVTEYLALVPAAELHVGGSTYLSSRTGAIFWRVLATLKRTFATESSAKPSTTGSMSLTTSSGPMTSANTYNTNKDR